MVDLLSPKDDKKYRYPFVLMIVKIIFAFLREKDLKS